MRALLSAVAIGILASGSAVAADLAARPVLTKGPIVVAPFDWSGVYIGGHIGGGWTKNTFADPGATAIFNACCNVFGTSPLAGGAAATDANTSSFLGGVQAGWMYQIGRLVVGSELDWTWTRLNASGAAFYPECCGGPDFANELYGVNTKWTATATTIVGVARDRVLFYGRAGAAWAHNDYTLAVVDGCNAGGPAICTFGPMTASDTVVGWTVATGVRWAFANSWFLDLHYDFMDFGSKAQNFSAVCVSSGAATCPGHNTAASTFNPIFDQRISEVKVGLNYKFPAGFLFW
jgi:outer membrane immunogenic protein